MKFRDALALRTRVSEHQTALEDEIREFNLAMTLALRPHSQSMDNEIPADELARARRMALAAEGAARALSRSLHVLAEEVGRENLDAEGRRQL